jgi:tRNA threonylcarbamoyladenosine biosynthesis protein TsaB
MNLLALDTSTSRAALAVARSDGGACFAHPDPATRHGRSLIPAIAELLRTAGLELADLGAVAVGLGPGSFTGLRIGLTAAKTLAYALGRPLYSMDSLEVIARNVPAETLDVAVIADAQRGDLFAAAFRRVAAGAALGQIGATRLVSIARWKSELPVGTLVVGPALEPLAAQDGGFVTLADRDANYPRGAGLVEAARHAMAADRWVDPWTVEPVYLRRSAAEENPLAGAGP